MNKKDKTLDKDAINLMMQALTPEELKLLKEEQSKNNLSEKRQKISLLRID